MRNRVLPQFSASDDWLNSAFAQIGELVCEEESPELNGAALAWVTALLMHGSTASMSQYLTNYAALTSRLEGYASLRRGLRSLRSSATIVRCTERAAPLTGFMAQIRSGSNRVLTPNAFSHDYLPPNHASAREAIRQIFRLRAKWTHRRDRTAALALSTYITFLTVHPFVDGNGRTCRMLLAADSMGGHRCDPAATLATFLLKSQHSLPFHISAKCARAGDFNMLSNCYRTSLDFTSAHLVPLLVELDQVPPSEHDRQALWAERIFSLVVDAFGQGNSRISSFAL